MPRRERQKAHVGAAPAGELGGRALAPYLLEPECVTGRRSDGAVYILLARGPGDTVLV
jgi:hypothetical protein